MGGLIMLFIGTYVGIIAVVWMVSSAFRDGGILGVIGLFVWLFICMWIASETCGDGKGGKKK